MATSSIVVGVRVRPFNQRELKYKSTLCVDMSGNTTSLISSRSKAGGEKPREFAFDYAFWTHDQNDVRDDRPFADQEHVYKALGSPLLDNALEGFNACLFCYGQTGAGKSFSMMGNSSEPGLLPRLVTNLFNEATERTKNGIAFKVECAFLEIYNEQCQDLLSTKGNVEGGLKVRQDPKKGIFVQGLMHAVVASFEQFDGLMEKALNNRAIAATNMNAVSSRSHAVIMITVVQVEAGTSCTRTSRMSMVDLAGSERAESTGASGATLTEAQNINYSLSVLGMCLTRLADIAEAKSGAAAQKLHVPFRDSKLTWLLSDNLGGNSKTSMIAAISPADVNFEETLSTMRFASVTKRVKTVAVVNESANDKLIRELKEELAQLQGTLRAMKEGGGSGITPQPRVRSGGGVGSTSVSENDDDDDDDDDILALEGDDDDDDDLTTQVSAADLLSAPPGSPSLSNNNKGSGDGGIICGADDKQLQHDEAAANEDVDWKAPQFLNLSPAGAVASPPPSAPSAPRAGCVPSPSPSRHNKKERTFNQQATLIVEGNNFFRLGSGTSVTVAYSGLTGEVTMTVTEIHGNSPSSSSSSLVAAAVTTVREENQVYVNGEPLQLNHPVHLKQNDRIVCGENVLLRFSHYQAILDAEGKSFRTEPDSERHALLLESYFRTLITQEQIDEMMGLLSWGLTGGDQSLHSAIADALTFLEIDQQMIQSALFAKESALAEEFPQINKMEGYDVDFDAKAFEKSRAQQEEQLRDKAHQLQNLKDRMARAAEDAEASDIQNRVFARTSREAALKQAQQIIESAENEVARMSEAARAEELALQESLDEAASERILAVELEYHKEVRSMRQFRAAPTDTEDLKIFQRQATILQNDARLNIQRCAESVLVCDPLVNPNEFGSRTVCLSRRFIFFFRKLYRREALLFSIYIPGCTTSLTKEATGGASSKASRFVLDITGAVARSPAPEHQALPPMVRLAFSDSNEGRAWKNWIDINATPVPPLSIWKRLLETEIAERRNHASSSPSSSGSSPSTSLSSTSSSVAHESEPGKPFETKGWAPDDSATHCLRCNKEFGFFTRKHHCRICGEIFCSNCLDGKKVCIACQAIISSSGKKEEELIQQYRTSIRRPERHRVILKEPVFSFIEHGKYFAFYCRGRMRQFVTRRDLDDFAVSLVAIEEENENNARKNLGPSHAVANNVNKPYLLDLFRGRFHEWCAVDISHVWRCSYHPLAVNLKLRDEFFAASSSSSFSSSSAQRHNLSNSINNQNRTLHNGDDEDDVDEDEASPSTRRRHQQQQQQLQQHQDPNDLDDSVFNTETPRVEDTRPRCYVSVVCTSVVDRERLFEGIAMMIGRRGYSPISQSGIGSNELDVLVVAPAEGTSSSSSSSPLSSAVANNNLSLTDAHLGTIRSCALKLTNALKTQLRIRVSHDLQGTRFQFQQGDFDIIAVVALNARPPWSGKYLRSAGMTPLCEPVPLSPANSLFVAADEHLSQHVTPPVYANARGLCILAFGVHESNLLFVASTANDVAEFEEVTDEEHSKLLQDEVAIAEEEGNISARTNSSSNNNINNINNNINNNNNSQQQQQASPGRVSTQPQLGSPTPDDLASPHHHANSPSGLPPQNDQKAVLVASALPLEKLVMWPLRDVDPVEQFENVFVIGHNTQLSGFSDKDKCGIQFKGHEGQVVVESKGHIECSIHVPQHILTSLRMKVDENSLADSAAHGVSPSSSSSSLPGHINVKIVRFFDTFGVEVHGVHDSRTSVVVNTPFEKCTQQEADDLNLSFTTPNKHQQNLGGGLAALHDSVKASTTHSTSLDREHSSINKVGNSIRLLDRVAEHCSSKNLFVVLHDFGTVTVPFHQFMNQGANRTTIVVNGLPVMYCGVQTGKVDLAISLF